MGTRRTIALLCVLAFGVPEGRADTGLAEPGSQDERQAVAADVRSLRERVERLEEAWQRALHVYEPPASMALGGTPVPLDQWDVAERLEREFLLSLGNRAQVILWLKRSARYFPYIERELHRAGLPDDLKYVAVIESSLLPNAYSPASALGIWQFIGSTARRFGLTVTSSWDERRNPERSTAAALAYLRDLHLRFRDWPLALAAYNAGEGRIEQAIRHQRVTSYYQLALPVETERYVFRALSAKLILSDAERYGFRVPAESRYRPHATDVVEVDLRERMAVADVALAIGSFYRELKELNPEVLDDHLPKGRYRLRVPKGRASQLTTSLPAPPPASSHAKTPKP